MTDEIHDLLIRARASLTDECGMSLAMQVVMLQFRRGDYDMLQVLDTETLKRMASEILKENVK